MHIIYKISAVYIWKKCLQIIIQSTISYLVTLEMLNAHVGNLPSCCFDILPYAWREAKHYVSSPESKASFFILVKCEDRLKLSMNNLYFPLLQLAAGREFVKMACLVSSFVSSQKIIYIGTLLRWEFGYVKCIYL